MSCDSLQQNFTVLNVSMGSLPEGFCPSSMQQLADSIAARLIITPSQSFSTFAVGSVEPTSNVGPWFKNCEEWFVFNDALARYIPIDKGGFNAMQTLSVTGAFVVPENVFRIRAHLWGAGGGGSAITATGASGGGGGGAYGVFTRAVFPGQIIPYTIGVGGSGGVGGPGNPGTNGTATTMDGTSAGGGLGATAPNLQGSGGTGNGFDFTIQGSAGGGMTGAGGTNNTNPPGGDSPQGGAGGQASSSLPNKIGILPGGGGAGGLNTAAPASDGGAGANGLILVEY